MCSLVFLFNCSATKENIDKTTVKNESVVENTELAVISICGKCGEIKGSENCCKPGLEKCSKCDAHKGSPGCCKLKENKSDLILCKCGHIKGSKLCCKSDNELCAKCGKAKGSPGCCL